MCSYKLCYSSTKSESQFWTFLYNTLVAMSALCLNMVNFFLLTRLTFDFNEISYSYSFALIKVFSFRTQTISILRKFV